MFASFNSNTMNAISAARTAPRPEYMNSHLGLFCGSRVVQSLVLFVMPVSNHESDRSCTCVSVLNVLILLLSTIFLLTTVMYWLVSVLASSAVYRGFEHKHNGIGICYISA
jgi:hypothetical protein